MISPKIIKIASNTKYVGLKNQFTHKSSLRNSLCGDFIKVEFIANKSKIKSMSKSSFVMEQLIEKDGILASEAEVVLVTVNSFGKPVKIPDILAKQLT